VTKSAIRETIEAAREYGGAISAVPVLDTTKTANPEGFVTGTLDRSLMWQAQTPQAFSRKILMQAYERAYIEGVFQTDDSALVERSGYRVKIVPGSRENIKITRPDDLLIATALLKARQESKP
jgi:2-C-methyl-D-erythritol 4-phosphate cytidylyltransferase